MNRNTSILWTLIVIIIIIGGGIWYYLDHASAPAASTPTLVASVNYACDNNTTIAASYYDASSTPPTDPNQPPTPGGSVALTISDGRTMTLPQTISADGARYAAADGSFVFWNKGNGAMVTEGQQPSYQCVQLADNPGGLPLTYESGTLGFSIRYPQNFTVDSTYQYQNLGPGKEINGVKFTIDPSIATGTNLGSDSYLSVEQIPNATSCTADMFLDLANGGAPQNVTDNGVTYSMASTTGAGAGNRYEETVYALPGMGTCYGVRYYIHYGVLQNYPAGSVKQFNETALLAQFDTIRHTLTLAQ